MLFDEPETMISRWLGDGQSGAVFDESRRYRYSPWRRWEFRGSFDPRNVCTFLALNPSTADENLDDPTIRRCIGYAKWWGFDAFVMVNAFAFRATDPEVMKIEANPIGLVNDECIRWFAENSGILIAAWGNDGSHLGRSVELRKMLADYPIHHLGLNQTGEPKHPLYLKADLTPVLWTGV